MRHRFPRAAVATAAAALIAVQAAGAARPATPVPALTPMLGFGAVVQVDIRARNGALVRRIRTHAGRVPQAVRRALDGTVVITPSELVLALAARGPLEYDIGVKLGWPGNTETLHLYDPFSGRTPTFQLPVKGYVSNPTPELHFIGAVQESDGSKAPLTLQWINLGIYNCTTFSKGPPTTVGGSCSASTGSLLRWTPADPIPVDTGQTISVTLRLIFSEVAPPS